MKSGYAHGFILLVVANVSLFVYIIPGGRYLPLQDIVRACGPSVTAIAETINARVASSYHTVDGVFMLSVIELMFIFKILFRR